MKWPKLRHTRALGPHSCCSRSPHLGKPWRDARKDTHSIRCHRITESQNGGGWQGPLWVTQSNPLLKQGRLQQAAQHRVQAVLWGSIPVLSLFSICRYQPSFCFMQTVALPVIITPNTWFLALSFVPAAVRLS